MAAAALKLPASVEKRCRADRFGSVPDLRQAAERMHPTLSQGHRF
jgi:hypothetical protein